MKSRLPAGMHVNKQQQMADVIKKAQKVQEEMEKAKTEIAKMEFSAVAGGSVVKVVANGAKEIKEITIKPDIIAQNDIEMLQDLLIVAVNDSLKKANEYYEAKMNEITGEINIPGMS